MSVVQVTELASRRKGSDDNTAVREYQRLFAVQTSAPADEWSVISAGAIPAVFSGYPGDPGAVAVRRQGEQHEDNALLWLVTVEYSSAADFNRPADVDFSPLPYRKAFVVDQHGNPVANSAGDGYDPPPEIDDSRLAITLEWNSATFSRAQAADYKDAVNSDAWEGYPPGTCKVHVNGARRVYANGYLYWRRHVEVHVDTQNGWQARILDQGFRGLVAGQTQVFVDETGKAYTSPVPMDGDGGMLQKGEAPVFRAFDAYPSKPFAALQLPATLAS